ncbi:MAG: hypothetical protein WAT93_09000 [Pontixanthobacter sp.]
MEIGKMPSGWKVFFSTAAAYNLVIGGLAWAAPDAPLMNRVVGLLVLCFGIIYCLVAREPARFAPALWAGVVGKVGVVAMLSPGVMDGSLPPETGPVLVGDFLFTLGFLAFLWRRRRD